MHYKLQHAHIMSTQ